MKNLLKLWKFNDISRVLNCHNFTNSSAFHVIQPYTDNVQTCQLLFSWSKTNLSLGLTWLYIVGEKIYNQI